MKARSYVGKPGKPNKDGEVTSFSDVRLVETRSVSKWYRQGYKSLNDTQLAECEIETEDERLKSQKEHRAKEQADNAKNKKKAAAK